MSDRLLKLKNKLHNAFKLSGFIVRREFCALIVQKFQQEKLNLEDTRLFEDCIKKLCCSLEQQCLAEKSIEKEHIEQAIEACLHEGSNKNETVFSTIKAFDFPKLHYDLDRKQYFSVKEKPKLLSDPCTKAQLFLDRYNSVLQRTKRNFLQKIPAGRQKLSLQTVDFLLTVTHKTLDSILILGSLLQVSEGKWFLEDPTGIVELDLKHAKYLDGFYVENSFVLVNGYYEGKILQVATIASPPGEKYEDSRAAFGNLNYFGGNSSVCLRESQSLKEYMFRNQHNMIFFFSDLWLDHPQTFEKLEILFRGSQNCPPVAFVFMGNFMSESYGSDMMEVLQRLFKKLGELISQFQLLLNNSSFVFVPGLSDPCTPHIVPRLPLPNYVTKELEKLVPKAVFTTNPCRIQYCTREIVVFRADVVPKLLQGTIHKPAKKDVAECVTKAIIGQGHLSPLSLNALPVHWDFDYTLRLYPLPNLVVVGDKSEPYQAKYQDCYVVNPGSFCDNGFQFKSYIPLAERLDDCSL